MCPKPPPILKICGLRTLADVRVAEACGATHVGFIVEVGRSPRSLTRRQARLLARAARAATVMVTTSEDPGEIAELAGIVQPTVVQLHGAPRPVTPLRAGLAGREVWQVVAVEAGPEPDLHGPREQLEAARASGADRVVLDAAKGGHSGGTGATIDWEAAAALVEAAGDVSVILAGGLHPGNVAEAIRRVLPAGVDASSGVEVAGNAKSPRLIRAFCAAVRQVTPALRGAKSTEPGGPADRYCF